MKLVLIVDKSRVVALLRHLCKVRAAAEAHGNLAIMAFHVVVHVFCFFLQPAIDPLEHICIAVVSTVNVIGTAVLHWQVLLQFCNAGRLPKFLLSADLTHLSCTALTRHFTYDWRVAGRWWGRQADEVSVHLCVPGSFSLASEANLRQIASLGLERVTTSKRW